MAVNPNSIEITKTDADGYPLEARVPPHQPIKWAYIEHLQTEYANLLERINASRWMPDDLIKRHNYIGDELIRAQDIVNGQVVCWTPAHHRTQRSLSTYQARATLEQ